MGMNLSATSGQRPLASLMSTVAPAASQNATVPTTPSTNSVTPAGSGVTNSVPQTGMMDLMRVMVGLISQIVSLISGGTSGNSPFAGALNNAALGAMMPAAQPPASGLPTPGAVIPTMSPNDAGMTDTMPSPLPTSMMGYGMTPNAMSPTMSSLDTANPTMMMGGYGSSIAPSITSGVTTPPAADTAGSQQCPNGAGASDAMGNPIPASIIAPGSTDTVSPSPGTVTPSPITPPAMPGMTTPTTPPITATLGVADDGSHSVDIFTASDYKNFLLAGSMGGTTGTAESINSKYADPNSRFSRTGNPQFQAAIAGMYANQFKGYALGQDVAYAPGKDINKMAQTLTQVEKVQMTPEAEMLSKVAALYRGNLTGVNLYDNPKLKTLLTSWGRNDIANQPNVGNPNGDVQSIGGVVKALNEEKNPTIRKAWLQQIFDFAGNSPSSPSGAVPNLPEYQQAISLVRNGSLINLLKGYQQTTGT